MPPIHLRAEDYRPSPPPDDLKRRYGIGIVGTGRIVFSSHLPAYRDFGYRVVGVCNRTEEKARKAAADFGVPFCASVEELLERPDVDIVDLAVHASQRLPLVEKIAAAGKHIFSQKPFALSLAEAQRMVDICKEAGVTLMINQQARWAPCHRALKVLLERGTLGHLYSVAHFYRFNQDVPGTWPVTLKDFNIMDHGIHYIDLSRYFVGREPLRVKANTTMMPTQAAISPMIYTILMEYDPEAHVMTTLHFNNVVQSRAMHSYEWHLDGTLGSASASRTELVVSLKERPDEKQVFSLQGQWFPDAFGGAMGEMLASIAEGREPQCSGRDNLASIRIAVAAVESSTVGRTVELR